MQQRQFSWNCLLASLTFFLFASPVRCQSQPYRSPAADSNARVPGVAVRYFTLSGSPTQIPLFDSLPSSSTTVPNISYPRSSGLPFASSPLVTNVGAVFTGFLTFPSPGKWTVSVSSDDGTRFFFWPEGSYPRVFISNDFLHAMQERRGVVNVQSQLTYAFALEYFQAGSSSGCILSWQPPGGSLDYIPSSAFTRPAAAYVPLPRTPSAAVSMSMGSLGESSASTAVSCFIATDQSLWCHGSNTYAQLPHADLSVTVLTPINTIASGVNAVALGGSHTCISNSSGMLMCWGASGRGQIGDGSSSITWAQRLPIAPSFPSLTPPVSSIVSFSLGYYHTCAVDAQSRMFCWGDGGNGRLGPNCSIGTDDSFNLLSGMNDALGFENVTGSDSMWNCNWGPSSPSRSLGKSYAGSYSLSCARTAANHGPSFNLHSFQHQPTIGSTYLLSFWISTDSSSLNTVKGGMTYNSAVGSVECSSSSATVFTCASTNLFCMCLKCAIRFVSSSSTSLSFGGITLGAVYYVHAILSATTFSISNARGGTQRSLTPGTGLMSLRLREVAISNCSTSAFQAAVSQLDTNSFFKTGRVIRFDSLNSGVFFGGVSSSVTYYISSVVGTTISISTSASGAALALSASSVGSNTLFIYSPDEYPGSTKSNINNQTWVYVEWVHSWPPSQCTNCLPYFAQYRIETTSGGGSATSTLFVDEVRLSQRENCAVASRIVPAPVDYAWIGGDVTPKLWRNVSLGWDHSCATDTSSALYCWGRNQEGQVGDGSITDVSRPRIVANLPGSVSSFSLGRYHTCAVASGSLYCWGAFSTTSSSVNYGQSGASGSVFPLRIEGITSAVLQVTCGKLHTCALDSARNVWCFGRNFNGQLGTGTTTNSAFPTPVQGIPHEVALLTNGMKGESVCAITVQQQRWCWGENNIGQLGDGSTAGRYEPVGGVSALVRIEPSGMFSIRNGMQLLVYGANSFGVSPYTVCSGLQLQAQTDASIVYDLTCSWIDPSVIEAFFYNPPNVSDADHPSIQDISRFDVVLTTANMVFSGVSISVYLRIDSVLPSAVVLSGGSLSVTVFSSGFSKISPSNNEPCLNAYIGQLPASNCSWHAQSGSVRLQLSAGTLLNVPTICSVSSTFQNCSANVSFVLSNRTFRSSDFVDSSWFSVSKQTDIVPVLPQVPLQEAATATEYTLAIIVGILGGVLVLLGSLWFCRKRAPVTRNVDDVLAALRKTVSGSSASNVKDLSDLDPQIKSFISDSDTCMRTCEEILGIVSENISTLGPSVQHLWCLLVSSSLAGGGLQKLNAFLDEKRHLGRVRFLAYGCQDLQGRVAIQIASQSCRECLEARFLFMKRFDIDLDKSQHISATSRVVIATEKLSAVNGSDVIVRKVALKFMKNRDQYEREKESREFFKDLDKYVVGIYYALTQQDDRSYREALTNSYFNDFKDYPFLVVMPSADCDLKTIISGENIAGRASEDFGQVKPILQALLTSVLNLHNAGVVHGDIKPRNIMRTGGISSFFYRLIDFDASACLPRSSSSSTPPKFCHPFVGSKSSSMYSPPELIAVDGHGHARVKEFHVTPSGECVANGSYKLVPASIAHDMWSLGAVFYELLTNETLFHGNSVSDNLDTDELPVLASWSDEIKTKRLLKVPNISQIEGSASKHPNFARNLLSMLLMKDPAARPRSIDHVLEHPLFRDGKSPGRLVGEKAKYDFFMSYRVAASVDAELLEGVWKILTERNYKVFWDKQELHKGREWEKEFCEGLVCSHVFVPLLSQAAIKNPKNDRANFEKLTEASNCDNVLLEHRLALELLDRGFVGSILPLLIGQNNDGVFERFSFAQLPSELPKVQVRALEEKLWEHLNNHCLGTPYDEAATVQDVFKRITAFQGHRVEGAKDKAILAVADELEKLRKMEGTEG